MRRTISTGIRCYLGQLFAMVDKLVIGDQLDETSDIGFIMSASPFDRGCGDVPNGLEVNRRRSPALSR